MSDTPVEVPLIELLRSIPSNARLWIDNKDGMGGTHYPVGHLMHRAADELAAATARIAELERLREAWQNDAQTYAQNAEYQRARAESAERDALQRAADVCEVKGMEWQRQYINAKENDHLLNGLSGGALDCRDAILALIPKERT